MKIKKPHGKKAEAIAICAFALLISLVLSATGCDKGGGDSDEQGNMTIDFGENGMVRNGTEYRTYQVEKGQRGIVSVSVTKESGRFDLDIYPAGRRDAPEYTGRELDSAAFDVILSEPGEYKVCVTATDFVGGYEIGWKTENSAEK